MKLSTSVRFLGTAAALFSSAAFAGTVAPDLAATNNGQTVQVIIRYANSEGARSRFAGQQTRSLGNFGEVRNMTAAEAKQAAANPAVAGVSMDHQVQGTATKVVNPTDQSSCPTAPACYDYMPQTISPKGNTGGNAGNGVGVAIIDSGITADSDLAGAVIHSENFSTDTTTQDLYGHGTDIAGIIAGNGTLSSGHTFTHEIHGVAPGVSLINLKVLDQGGTGTDSQVIQAIQWAIAHQIQYNIQVINLSLGRPVAESYTTDPLCQAVEQAWLSGITVVVAAGNQGRDNYLKGNQGYFTIAAPGNDPLVITVGATNLPSARRTC